MLVCDPLAQDGIDILSMHAQVDTRYGLSPQDLIAIAGDYNALIVRSGTAITAEVIAAAKHLQVIGRAGVGVDNIDLQAATERGIVVVNAPTGNTVSAAEHTIGLMLALARHIPDAHHSLKSGEWNRARFLGVELRGKTMGVVGLGQVGSEVARRARSLEMRVVGYDPFIAEERARLLGIELLPLDELLSISDFISLHATLTPDTYHLISERELALMKPTARLINTARGELIDEEALYRALEEGRLAGAALDVFSREPATDNILLKSDKVIVTPHLAASTAEAQEQVAIDVAEQVIDVFQGRPARYAVNLPLIPPESMSALAPFLIVSEKTASVAAQISEGQVSEIEVEYAGEIAEHDVAPLTAGVIRGLLEPITEERVNLVNARLIAQRRGLRIKENKSLAVGFHSNLITVRLKTSAGGSVVSGTLAHERPHIVQINDFWVDIPINGGYLLLLDNLDKPGMIGAVGTMLGGFDVNISFMNVGRSEKRGRALMVLLLDEPLTPEQLRQLRDIPNIFSARFARL